MSKKAEKKEAKHDSSTRQLIGAKAVTDYSLVTYREGELVYFIVKPSNISVLSEASVGARIYALMTVLKGVAEIEMLCLNSRESFEDNKRFLRSRMEQEDNPVVRKLLEKDQTHLDRIQVQMATAREFLIIVRLKDEKESEVFSYLSAIGVAIPIYFLMISVIWGIAMGVLILLSQFYGAGQLEQVKKLFSHHADIFCSAATRIEAFILIPVQTMGNAVTIFVGQNIGAGQMERLKKGVRFSMIISMGVIIGLSVCMLLFGENIVSLITGTNVKAMESGNTYFSICAWFYPLTAIMYCLSGMLEGAGDTLIAAVYSAASIFTRLVVALVLAPTLGFLSIAIASCFGWGIAVIIICARYFKGTWKSKSFVQTQECQVIPPSNQD